MDICRLHTSICTENVVDTSAQTEDFCQDEVFVNSAANSANIPLKADISGTLHPMTFTGVRPYIWQPPEA
jgi:hypothetical protein